MLLLFKLLAYCHAVAMKALQVAGFKVQNANYHTIKPHVCFEIIKVQNHSPKAVGKVNVYRPHGPEL